MNDSVDKILPDSDFELVSREVASRLGVAPGRVPRDSTIGDVLIQTVARQESWCSPLVVAGPFEIFDFTGGYDANRQLQCLFGLGRFDEDRVGMYETDLFRGEVPRTIHMGLDIGAAEGTPIFSPFGAVVFGSEYLPAEGDYGGTLILKLKSSVEIFVLLGHLSKATVARWSQGDSVVCGELLGWLGGKTENGGWNPHLHWQLSWLQPVKVDLPGAVAGRDRDFARRVFSDPTGVLDLVLGGTRGKGPVRSVP